MPGARQHTALLPDALADQLAEILAQAIVNDLKQYPSDIVMIPDVPVSSPVGIDRNSIGERAR